MPNLDKLISGYNAQYNNYDYLCCKAIRETGRMNGWVEFVRIVDWLTANGFPIMTAEDLDAHPCRCFPCHKSV